MLELVLQSAEYSQLLQVVRAEGGILSLKDVALPALKKAW